MYGEFGLEATHNKFGFMHPLTPFGEQFVDFSSQNQDAPLLDIGCAFGVTTLPCLLQGARVIAADIEQSHLDELYTRTPEECRAQLTLQQGRFPEELDFEPNSLSGVMISHVLSFLSEQQLVEGFQKLARWLKPGGKVFIVNYTPYHKPITGFIPDYQQALAQKKVFAGYVANKAQYCDSAVIRKGVPNEVMLMDLETVEWLLAQAGFTTEYCQFVGGEEAGVPEPFRFDGREWINAIGVKPMV